MWVKVFKNGQSKIFRRQPLKNLTQYGLLYQIRFFKGCLPKISLVPFSNALTHMSFLNFPRVFRVILYRKPLHNSEKRFTKILNNF